MKYSFSLRSVLFMSENVASHVNLSVLNSLKTPSLEHAAFV